MSRRMKDQAPEHLVERRSQGVLRTRLELTAVRDRDLDHEVAVEWSEADLQEWRQLDEEGADREATRGTAQSTSRQSTPR